MILSRQNSLIKLSKSLSDKKFRDREGLYLVVGVKMVKEAMENHCDIFRILVTPACREKAGEFLRGIDFDLVEESVFKSISGEVTPQGILAIVKKPQFGLEKPKGKCLFLDGMADPSNVGAIIRTAAASGYNDIYAFNCADPFSPKAVRSSMSGIFKVKIHVGERGELLDKIDFPIVVADMGGEDVFSVNLPQNFCLVIGNEGKGVSQTLKDLANYTVSIPMQNGMESLNASVSAGILMYLLGKKQ